MPNAIDWKQVAPLDATAQIVEELNDGKVVAFPTDTAYVAAVNGALPGAASRLCQTNGYAKEDGNLILALSGMKGALEWVPNMSTIGRRFASRCWPGPLTLVCLDEPAGGGANGARKSLCGVVNRNNEIHLGCPAHEAIYGAVQEAPFPIVFSVLQSEDGAGIFSADILRESDSVDLLVDDGATYFQKSASVIAVNGRDWTCRSVGALSEDELKLLAGCQIVFICTGNTCRSPLAEALCKKLLAEHIGCVPEELSANGYIVQSAGIAALSGSQASEQAVTAALKFGVDLSPHQSRPLTYEMLTQADHLYAMTQSHLQVLTGHNINTLAIPQLLTTDGADIADPIGGELNLYEDCARQISQALEQRRPEFLES